jgi:hypothetical protein
VCDKHNLSCHAASKSATAAGRSCSPSGSGVSRRKYLPDLQVSPDAMKITKPEEFKCDSHLKEFIAYQGLIDGLNLWLAF